MIFPDLEKDILESYERFEAKMTVLIENVTHHIRISGPPGVRYPRTARYGHQRLASVPGRTPSGAGCQ